jgi:hypothetical protein
MLHLGFASILLCLSAPAGPAEKQPAQAALRPAARTYYLAERLGDTVDFQGFDDPKMTLQDALEYLADRYDLSFDVDEKAFARAIGKDKPRSVLQDAIATSPMPRMRGVGLETVLRKILARIDVPSGATYLIHKGQILITTQAAASEEVLGDSQLPLPALVHKQMQKRLLRDALDELAELTDANIVLDESVGEKAKETVTARFLNTPVDTAVRILANKAGLSMVRLDNVLYVTTREKADELRDEIAQERNRDSHKRMPPADDKAEKDTEEKYRNRELYNLAPRLLRPRSLIPVQESHACARF